MIVLKCDVVDHYINDLMFTHYKLINTRFKLNNISYMFSFDFCMTILDVAYLVSYLSHTSHLIYEAILGLWVNGALWELAS